MTKPRDLTITEALKRIGSGELTAVNLLESCWESSSLQAPVRKVVWQPRPDGVKP